MKNRQLLTLGIITAIIAVMLMFPITGHAIIDMGSITDDGANITWVIDNDGTLILSGSGELPYYEIASLRPWYSNDDDITAVEVTGDITTIRPGCFSQLDNLTKITITAKVTEIRGRSFGYNPKLTEVILPSTLENLSVGAFSNSTKLTTINFSGANQHFVIKNGVLTDADETIIYWGGGLNQSEYYIPATVTQIGEQAFNSIDPEVVKKIYVPSTVTKIGTWAFYDSSYLCGVADSAIDDYIKNTFDTDTVLLESYNGMCGPTAFWKITTISDKIHGTITTLTIKGTGDIDDYQTNNSVPWGRNIGIINIVNVSGNITSIGDRAFGGMAALQRVTLPDSISDIGAYSFYRCSSLTNITLPAELRTIGTSAFSGCTSLAGVIIPSKVTSLGATAFADTALTTINIPAGLTSIASLSAFESCTSLSAINVASGNSSYTSLDGVLYTRSKMSLLIYPPGKTDESYYVPDTVNRIDANCYGSTNLKHIYIPQKVVSIDVGAFSACEGLTIYGYTGSVAEKYATDNSITFKKIAGSAGTNAEWLFDLKTGVLTISGTGEMSWNTNDARPEWSSLSRLITEAVVSEGITSIGPYAFELASKVAKLTIPWTVTEISGYSFSSTDSLTDIYYTGAIDDWNKIKISQYANMDNNVNIHCVEQVLDGVGVIGNSVFVTTENVRQGKKVMVATYTADNKYLDLYYVTIGSDFTGSVAIDKTNVGKVKAFIIDFSNMMPLSNAVWSSVQ